MPKDKNIIKDVLDKLISMGYSFDKKFYNELSKENGFDVIDVNTEGFVNENGMKFPKDHSVLLGDSEYAFQCITKDTFEQDVMSQEEMNYYNDFKIVSWNDFLDGSFKDTDKKEIFEFVFENEFPLRGSFRWINNGKPVMEINKKTIRDRMEFIQGVIDLIERSNDESIYIEREVK